MALQLSEAIEQQHGIYRETPTPPKWQRAASLLSLENVSKSFGEKRVLQGVTLQIEPGEFVGVIGRSGCGKSTLLRLLAGLETPSEGNLQMDDQPLTGLNTRARMMFQDARLLPWKRVWENVTLGLQGIPHTERRQRALTVLTQVGLPDRGNDWPLILSGGQKQRVALARALATEPPLLLLDEPLGALDALTRLEMQELVETVWRERGFTAVLVTHDVEEAVTLCDRIILLSEGDVAMDLKITLPRPRSQTSAAFAELKQLVLSRVLRTTDI